MHEFALFVRELLVMQASIVSIVLFVSPSAFVLDLKRTSEHAQAVSDYDICFGTLDSDASTMLKLYGELETATGVTGSSYQVVMKYTCAAKASELSDACWESAGAHSPSETRN